MSHVLWSAVTRDDVVLAEASDTGLDTSPRRREEAGKGAAGQAADAGVGLPRDGAARGQVPRTRGRVWACACVHDASLESMLAKGFLEKLALMTEPCREEAAWRTGATLSQQRR